MSNSISRATSFSDEASAAHSGEESGWTTYFEDFFSSEKRREKGEGGSCNLYSSTSINAPASSLISDAASCAQWKLPAMPMAMAEAEASEGRKKLSFKKRKGRRVVLDDDPLEDTASSPVNSPKVSNMNHLNSNEGKKNESGYISQLQEKGVGLENCMELGRGKMDETGFVESTDNECTELKKRGLCLIGSFVNVS